MKNQDFLNELALILATSASDLKPDSCLADLKAWDSMGKMAVITLLDMELQLVVPYELLESLKTVADLQEFAKTKLEE